MLRDRVVTSVVLAAVVVSALLLLPPAWLVVVLAAMFLVVGGSEGAVLAGLGPGPARLVWIGGLCAVGALLVWAFHFAAAVPGILAAASAFWAGLAFWIVRPALGRAGSDRLQPAKLAIVGVILLSAFVAIAWLHVIDPWLVIYLILIIAAADIGAYFSGISVGGPKLAPSISPGKTWAGAAGGLVAAILVGAVGSRVVPDVPFGPLVATPAAAVLVAVSVFGDLVFSLMKRHRSLKDTSTLLPGHGGLLDRVDSLAAAAPPFALLVWWMTG
ncbi:MAG: phosphatidate cytidylyltransferase [Wenzhouxiangellaceae bacterium]|nr:phosphatidate cytidylyltransferase [Wenzhouxiangellaceae bacterium]